MRRFRHSTDAKCTVNGIPISIASLPDAANAPELTAALTDSMSGHSNAAGSPALDGTFTLDTDNALLGMLMTGTAAPVICNGNYSPASQQFTIICGSCVMNLIPAT